jgi:hypothetical protein
MERLPQAILILSTLLAAWLGMQAVHEAGHVLGAWWSGGKVERVVVHPLTISRTDVSDNPHPLFVVWAGPIFGVVAPLMLWGSVWSLKLRGAFVLRFFAGFCLIANGLYIGVGSFDNVGDCGEMLRNGSQLWQLWLFGLGTAPAGLWLWHRQGKHFGLGASGKVDKAVAYAMLGVAVLLLVVSAVFGGE